MKRETEEIREERNRDSITKHKQTLALRSAVLFGVPGKEGFWKGLDPCPRLTVALCLPGLGRNFPFSKEQAADTNVRLLRFQEGKWHRQYDRGKGAAAFPSSPAWLHSSPGLNGKEGLESLEGGSWLQSHYTGKACLFHWKSHLPTPCTKLEGAGRRETQFQITCQLAEFPHLVSLTPNWKRDRKHLPASI